MGERLLAGPSLTWKRIHPGVTVSNPAPGDTFRLIATVDSTGNAPAAPTTLRYYRSADATIATSDTEVGPGCRRGGMRARWTRCRRR